ncbi:MAG: efflux RND transporter periplasmic adaptor subunit [bacterium]|nr:efflux RND transporter periplasmic adaptor subunit [bacterium]
METSNTPNKRGWIFIATVIAALVVLYAAAAFASAYFLKPGNRLRTVLLAPVRALPGVFSFSGGGGADTGGALQELKVARAQGEEIEATLESSGEIEYFEKVDIVAKTAGRLDKIFVQKGAIVKSGQALAQLERLPLELQARQQRAAVQGEEAQLRLVEERYANARRGIERREKEISSQRTLVKQLRAVLDKARATFRGQEILHNAGGISREEYETARTELISREADYLRAKKELEILEVGFRDSDLRAAGMTVPSNSMARFKMFVDLNTRTEKAEVDVQRSRVESARAELQNTAKLLDEATLRTPIAGVVATRNASPGEEVRPGGVANSQDALLVVVDISKVYALVNIREADVKNLQPGMKLRFTVDVYPDEEYEGVIKLIDPIVDSQTHTVGVRAELKNPDFKLRPGMFLRGAVVTGEKKQAVLIPAGALQPGDGDQGVVFVVREDRVYRVEVTPGRRREERVEILDGLKADDLVALEKFSLLRDGLKVQPVISGDDSEKPQTDASQAP